MNFKNFFATIHKYITFPFNGSEKITAQKNYQAVKNENDNFLASNHNRYYVTAGEVDLAAFVPVKNEKNKRLREERREGKGSFKNIFCGTESFSFFGTKNISLM